MRVPLDFISQIFDSGASVIFTRTGGNINHLDGSVTKFVRDGDNYMRETWIPRALFTRPSVSS